MELKDLIFLGACSLLAPEVANDGLTIKDRNISRALEASKKIWAAVVEDKEI